MFGFLTAVAGTGFSITVCGLGLGVYLAAALAEAAVIRPSGRRSFPAWPVLTLLLASLAVSVAISQYRWISFRGLWKYLEGFILLYAGIDLIRDTGRIRLFLAAFLTVLFIAAAAGLFQDLYGADFLYWRAANPYHGDVLLRVTGTFKHCNDYATFLLPGFCLASALGVKAALGGRRAAAAGFAGLFVLLSYALVRSLSRGAMVGVFASFVVFSLFFRWRWRALGALALVLAALFTVPSPVSERLQGLLNVSSDTMPERFLLLETGWRMVRQSPVFGLGLNTYSDYFPQFRPEGYPSFMYAHNSYLQMATESGLLGIGLYLAFTLAVLGWIARRVIAAPEGFERCTAIALLSGVAGLLVNALFESLLQSTQLRTLFWCLLGTAAGIAMNFAPGAQARESAVHGVSARRETARA